MLRAMQSGKCYDFALEQRRGILPDTRLRYFRSTVEGYARFSPANSKWTKHTVAAHVSIGGNGPVLVGTPAQVADGLEIWVREGDVDGFNFVREQSRMRRATN